MNFSDFAITTQPLSVDSVGLRAMDAGAHSGQDCTCTRRAGGHPAAAVCPPWFGPYGPPPPHQLG